ncbi:MAG: sporulation protein YabP [Oscillospiraceae bacterium]|nr:sporulation protein YabP [Ruminococcus sp.]MCD8345109.1 sporulation protein YabP [Oscillospiraceae bacterium]
MSTPETPLKKHNLILEDRQKLSLSGVTDVESFDDSEVSLYTSQGELVIRGKNLHVDEISLETGDLELSGEVKSLIYGDRDRTRKATVWRKITR